MDISSDEPNSPPSVPSPLRDLIQDFQSFPLSPNCLHFDEKGLLKGSLIDKLRFISQQSVQTSKYVLQNIQNLQITQSVMENLLSGICSEIFPFSRTKAWLTDIPIDAMQLLIDSKLQELPDKCDRAVPLTSLFYSSFVVNREIAFRWFKQQLVKFQYLHEGELLLKQFLLPINTGNFHWILGVIDCTKSTFSILDPFQPANPPNDYIQKGQLVCDAFSQEFNLPKFTHKVWNYSMPTQQDTHNCGVFVIWFMLYFSLGPDNIYLDLASSSIDKMRVLITSWLLKGSLEGM